jgi:hypothetical protein
LHQSPGPAPGLFLFEILRLPAGCWKEAQQRLIGNIFAGSDLLHRHDFDTKKRRNPLMDGRITDRLALMDHKTSRSICDAVGQRLQHLLRPDYSRLSRALQELLDKLRRRDRERKL